MKTMIILANLVRARPPFASWSIALALVLTSVALRLSTSDSSSGTSFLAFHPAVAATALICGRAQALAALLLSAVAALFLSVHPTYDFGLGDVQAAVTLLLFLGVGAVLIFTVSLLRDQAHAFAKSAADLALARFVQDAVLAQAERNASEEAASVAESLRRARLLSTDSSARDAILEAEARLREIARSR